MNNQRLPALTAAAGLAALLSGCVVVPADPGPPVAAYPSRPVYVQPAPIVVVPAPGYYYRPYRLQALALRTCFQAFASRRAVDNRRMTIREILKMGDPRLLRVAQPVTAFDTDELHLLISDMFDTMRAVNGAGLAAPQIGVDLQLVIFGTDAVNPRYPDAPLVPRTVLLNPVITPLAPKKRTAGKAAFGARAARPGAALVAHPL